jgi:hypothetical protein
VAAFYLDNNLAVQIAEELIRLGHFARTASDLALTRASDATHLMTAARRRWILVTNDGDFIVLQAAWLEWPSYWGLGATPEHAGILLIPQEQLGGPAPAAHLVDRFVSTSPALSNSLWRWTVSRGWFVPP